MSGTSRQADDRTSDLPLFDAGGTEEFDPWAGWADCHLPRHPKVTVEQLDVELRKLLKSGLPATMRTAGDVLPHLRSVLARSVHPYDPVSRVDSLNQLLVRLLVEMDDEQHGEASRVLFAVSRGMRGTTLTERRATAALVLSYNVTHFRKHIEPKLIEELATALYTDLLRYKRRVRRSATSEEPTGDTPRITADDFTHEEELISRIWQHVYGLRAEVIATGRLEGQPGYESQAEDHRQAATSEQKLLELLTAEYVVTYGALLPHGEAEYRAEALVRLAGFDEACRPQDPVSE